MWCQTSSCSPLLIYRPREDERLSWPGWLTSSGRFTHKVVTRQLKVKRATGKVRQPRPPCHATIGYIQCHVTGTQYFSWWYERTTWMNDFNASLKVNKFLDNVDTCTVLYDASFTLFSLTLTSSTAIGWNWVITWPSSVAGAVTTCHATLWPWWPCRILTIDWPQTRTTSPDVSFNAR